MAGVRSTPNREMNALWRLVFTGAECSGKTTAVERWARHTSCPSVLEYACTYWASAPGKYTEEEVLVIGKGQSDLENEAAQHAVRIHSPVLWIDTDHLNIDVWLQRKFGKPYRNLPTPPGPRVYVLMPPLPTWIPHPLREAPDLLERTAIYEDHKKRVMASGLPFVVYQNDAHLLRSLEQIGVPLPCTGVPERNSNG